MGEVSGGGVSFAFWQITHRKNNNAHFDVDFYLGFYIGERLAIMFWTAQKK